MVETRSGDRLADQGRLGAGPTEKTGIDGRQTSPRPGRAGPLIRPSQFLPEERALRVGPRPLLDPDRKLMVVWSPKSACTTTFVWFLGLIGKIEEARAYHKWPHTYRIDKYYNSELYERGTKVPLNEYRMIRVIRDPYSRAVSSYRHAVGTQFAEEMLRQYDPSIDRKQGGFSFWTYLDFLSTVDMRTTNVHQSYQYHPIEAFFRPFEVINVTRQNLFEQLNAVEERLGWARTDFGAIEWIRESEDHRKASIGEFEGAADDVPLNMAAAKGKLPWPSSAALLTPRAKERIAQLYHVDLEAYRQYL
jgi:hypothetical protein